LRIARDESFHNIVLSMKASNPQVMVQAYRLLIKTMQEEFGTCYPLHLGVTEAGDGEDGRIKSAAGIGTLLEDGIGDTVRVSLTEDPEFEIPVCRDLVKRYHQRSAHLSIPAITKLPYSPFSYKRRDSFAVGNIGGNQVPVVIADLSHIHHITPAHLESVGYRYDAATDKWSISDAAADYIFTGHQQLDFALPGTLKVIVFPETWKACTASVIGEEKNVPFFMDSGFAQANACSNTINFVVVDCFSDATPVNDYTFLDAIANDSRVVICLRSSNMHAMPAVRRMFCTLMEKGIRNPVVLMCESNWQTADEHLIHYATECGALLIDGMGDGISLSMSQIAGEHSGGVNASGRNYLNNATAEQFLNQTAFGILQATRTRISKTEYISCPSCGRTLFDLQETTAKIRSVTHHLKGVKIAIMGCIVNGPGEMADADFGYVGSGPGKITLYKGKEIVKRNVDSEVAVEELIALLKDHGAWVDPVLS
ncbi:MAG: flavodoxin-dependent (E)-4-hydroxy-3-methylbut-2-enyl-diphosphate synthase, partial [Chitinophagaceae bacterium]